MKKFLHLQKKPRRNDLPSFQLCVVYPLSCRNIIFQQSVFFSYLNAPLGNPNHVCPSPLTQVSPKGRHDIFKHQLCGCRKVERNVSSERLKHNPSVIKGV